MGGRENGMDRKNKHCRRPEDHPSTGGLEEDKWFSVEVCGVWDPDQAVGLLPQGSTRGSHAQSCQNLGQTIVNHPVLRTP